MSRTKHFQTNGGQPQVRFQGEADMNRQPRLAGSIEQYA